MSTYIHVVSISQYVLGHGQCLRLGKGSRPGIDLLALVLARPHAAPVKAPVPIQVHACALGQATSVLAPQPLCSVSVFVAVWVGNGQNVEVDLLQIVGLGLSVLNQFAQDVCRRGGGDPLASVGPWNPRNRTGNDCFSSSLAVHNSRIPILK